MDRRNASRGSEALDTLVEAQFGSESISDSTLVFEDGEGGKIELTDCGGRTGAKITYPGGHSTEFINFPGDDPLLLVEYSDDGDGNPWIAMSSGVEVHEAIEMRISGDNATFQVRQPSRV